MTNHSDKKILYADDDPDDQELLARAFYSIKDNIEVIFAENGLIALETLDKLKSESDLPCVIILDINMPFLDGKHTLERIRKDAALKNVRVFVFTSSSSPADKAYFEGFGIEMFTKPVNPANLQQIAQLMLKDCS